MITRYVVNGKVHDREDHSFRWLMPKMVDFVPRQLQHPDYCITEFELRVDCSDDVECQITQDLSVPAFLVTFRGSVRDKVSTDKFLMDQLGIDPYTARVAKDVKENPHRYYADNRPLWRIAWSRLKRRLKR